VIITEPAVVELAAGSSKLQPQMQPLLVPALTLIGVSLVGTPSIGGLAGVTKGFGASWKAE
jgi:hypothetical protein